MYNLGVLNANLCTKFNAKSGLSISKSRNEILHSLDLHTVRVQSPEQDQSRFYLLPYHTLDFIKDEISDYSRIKISKDLLPRIERDQYVKRFQ